MKNNNTFTTKSKIHKLNPTLKFIGFILLIAMIFLPLGFFVQTIIGTCLLIVFFMAKLKKKVLWNILKSVVILFILLLLVNWAFYKDPLALNYLNNGRFNIFIGSQNLIGNAGAVHYFDPSTGTVISPIWGGTIGLSNSNSPFINWNDPIIDNIITENKIDTKYLVKYWNGYNDSIRNTLLKLTNNNELLAQKFLWVINNDWMLNGIKYKTSIINNANLSNLNQVVVYSTNWYSFSPKAIELALFVSIKVFLMILAATILTSTTNSIELTYALENLLSPLKLFRLPVNEASMMIAIALRFIPSLLSESKRIMNAQASRGIDFSNGNLLDKSKAIVSLVVPLFSIAFKKAEDLANAMDVRAYNPRYARTRYRKFRIFLPDWIGYFFLALLFGILIAFLVVPTLFTPFGLFELATLS